ncbi:MAG: hypothetical protein IJ080_06605 [Oscillospiraceae bacterium]|nr:hypothetical protein [Oscillospiraceae bacterium]
MADVRDIDEMIKMIDGKMGGDTARLKVEFSDKLEEDSQKETVSYGRCAAGVCDITEKPSDPDKE